LTRWPFLGHAQASTELLVLLLELLNSSLEVRKLRFSAVAGILSRDPIAVRSGLCIDVSAAIRELAESRRTCLRSSGDVSERGRFREGPSTWLSDGGAGEVWVSEGEEGDEREEGSTKDGDMSVDVEGEEEEEKERGFDYLRTAETQDYVEVSDQEAVPRHPTRISFKLS
jgi:hypothetical protein